MTPLTTAVDELTKHPELLAALVITVRVIHAYQSELTWPEYRTIHRFKCGVFPVLKPLVGKWILLVSEKDGRDDAEFLHTIDGSVRGVVKSLQQAGGSLHVLCSVKRRPDTNGMPLSAAHVVWDAESDQVEGYLFRNSDGTVDLYAHTETSVVDPLGHLTNPQTDGDAHGVIPDITTA